MQIEIITIFPEIFESFLRTSLIGKAIDSKKIEVTTTALRNYADPPHYRVDDTPYGGGAGMVLMAEPILRAVQDAKQRLANAPVVLLAAQGQPFRQAQACEFSQLNQLIMVCGRYEGVDQRAIDLCVDRQVSIGDFVLMGGEVAAMAVIESTIRLLDGVVGNSESVVRESFSSDSGGRLLLEAPQYTKPREVRGKEIPAVLLSGDHRRVSEWRQDEALRLTRQIRPDLLCEEDR